MQDSKDRKFTWVTNDQRSIWLQRCHCKAAFQKLHDMLLCRKYKPGMATVQQPLVWLQKTVYSSQAWLNFSIDTHVTNLLQRIFDFLDSWLLLLRAILWIRGCCPSQCIWVYAYGVMTDQIRVFLRVSLLQTSLKFFLKISRGLFYKRVSRFALEFLKILRTKKGPRVFFKK